MYKGAIFYPSSLWWQVRAALWNHGSGTCVFDALALNANSCRLYGHVTVTSWCRITPSSGAPSAMSIVHRRPLLCNYVRKTVQMFSALPTMLLSVCRGAPIIVNILPRRALHERSLSRWCRHRSHACDRFEFDNRDIWHVLVFNWASDTSVSLSVCLTRCPHAYCNPLNISNKSSLVRAVVEWVRAKRLATWIIDMLEHPLVAIP